MVNFDALSCLDEARNGGLLNQSREQAAPSLRREEERAIFTFTKILQTHQLNMLFGTLEAEVLYQVEQTWGVNFPSEEIKLTIPDHAQYRRLLLPADMTVREALDRYHPRAPLASRTRHRPVPFSPIRGNVCSIYPTH